MAGAFVSVRFICEFSLSNFVVVGAGRNVMPVGGGDVPRSTWKVFDYRPFISPSKNLLSNRLAAPSCIFLGAKMLVNESDFKLIEYPYLEGDHYASTAGQFIRPLEQLRFMHSHSLVHGDIHRGNIVFGNKPATSVFPVGVNMPDLVDFKRRLTLKAGSGTLAEAGADSMAASSAVATCSANDDEKYGRPSSSLIDFDMMGIAGVSQYAPNFRWEFEDSTFGKRRLLANNEDRCMAIEDDVFSMCYLMQLYCVSDAGASSSAVASDGDAVQAWQSACSFVEQNNLSRAIECLVSILDVRISHLSANSGSSASASNTHQEQGTGSPDRKPQGATQNQPFPRGQGKRSKPGHGKSSKSGRGTSSTSSSSSSSSPQSSLASISETQPEAVVTVLPAEMAAVSPAATAAVSRAP
jgi:hypothetical protein